MAIVRKSDYPNKGYHCLLLTVVSSFYCMFVLWFNLLCLKFSMSNVVVLKPDEWKWSYSRTNLAISFFFILFRIFRTLGPKWLHAPSLSVCLAICFFLSLSSTLCQGPRFRPADVLDAYFTFSMCLLFYFLFSVSYHATSFVLDTFIIVLFSVSYHAMSFVLDAFITVFMKC